MTDGEADVIVGQRVYGCELIQQMGIMLRLPQVAIATAQVMFHRFYARRSMRRFDVRVRALPRPPVVRSRPQDRLSAGMGLPADSPPSAPPPTTLSGLRDAADR